jgi:hypothetical protein
MISPFHILDVAVTSFSDKTARITRIVTPKTLISRLLQQKIVSICLCFPIVEVKGVSF